MVEALLSLFALLGGAAAGCVCYEAGRRSWMDRRLQEAEINRIQCPNCMTEGTVIVIRGRREEVGH